MFRRSLCAASLILSACGLWPTTELECLSSGRCTVPLPEVPPSDGPLVFGQPGGDVNRQLSFGLKRPTHAMHVGQKLFIVDQQNHRVLGWNSRPSRGTPPDLVLGQPDLHTGAPNNPTLGPSSLNLPHSLASDGTRLFVADSGNCRVLVWNQLPTRNAQPADLVLGQPSFTTHAPGLSASAFGSMPDVAFAQRLFITDRGNNRLLIYNTLPTQSYAAADVVLGQANKTSGQPNRGQSLTDGSGLSSPSGPAAIAGSALCVADSGNHRALCWDNVPSTDGANPGLVLGQPNFTSSMANANNTNVGPVGMVNPLAVAGLSGGRVIVTDFGHNRVLEWPGGTTGNGDPAEVVIGQPNFLSGGANTGGTSALSLFEPEGLAVYSGSQEGYVADSGNHRVLYYADVHLPTNAPPPAVEVYGQPDFASGVANNAGGVSGTVYGEPISVSGGGGRLALVDRAHHRVLLWHSMPTSPSQPPDLALGQPDLVSRANYHGGPISGDGFEDPAFVWTDGTRLLVADLNRVLIWNTWPTAGLTRADSVLGQPSFAANKENWDGVTATGLWRPTGVASDGTRIFVSDAFNHRVLIWNRPIQAVGQPADLVLGQFDFQSNMSNLGDTPCTNHTILSNASLVVCPQDISTDGTRLAIASYGDHRVLIWNSIPTANYAPADLVLGQSDFSQNAAPVAPTASTLSLPVGVHFAGARLYVSDLGFHRVLYWDAPSRINQPADGVIGQPDLQSVLPNNGGLSIRTLSGPLGVWSTAERLLIVDVLNYRLLSLPLP